MYNLVDISSRVQLEQAYELVDLFKKLDKFTENGKPVVITDELGEIKAGNMLAWQWAKDNNFTIK